MELEYLLGQWIKKTERTQSFRGRIKKQPTGGGEL